MRCKVGDLAVQVAGDFPQNIGALYRVIDRHRCIDDEWRVETLSRVVTNLHPAVPGDIVWINDYCLLPIRDSDGADETLTWKDVPKGVPA